MTTSPTSPASSNLPTTASNAKPGIATIAADLFPAVLAGLIAVLISYAGPMLLMLQAAQAAHLTSAQTSSWLWAVSIGSGLSGAWMSWRYKIPVICAWNTPGAALLVTALATLPYNQAIAAYLFAAAIIFMIGVTGIFEKLMSHIPKSLCAAMLAGILMRFGVDVFASARSEVHGAPYLVGLMFIAYLFYKKRSARYAIVLTLLTGVLLWSLLGWGDAANTTTNAAAITWQAGLTLPVWTTPEFSVSALISLGLPLALLCLTGQQVPGVAVLRAAGYEHAPSSKLVSGTGLASLLLAPFGSHGVNLAAITAAICTGPEAHHQPEKRWVAGLACGVFYLLIGSFAGSLTTLFLHLPHALVTTVAGLALLGATQNGLVNAMQETSEREAALITFIVTASNISLLGLGSACWGIALGVLSYYLLRSKVKSPVGK